MPSTKQSTSIQIRPAGAADIETVVDFNHAMALETEGKELSRSLLRSGVAAAIETADLARYFLAVDGDEVVGQLMVTTEWSDWRNGSVWWIQSVYVRPDQRRRGVFRSLYRYVERLAEQTPSVVGLRLYVEHQNSVAQQTYRGLGMLDSGYVVYERIWSR